MTRIDLLPEEVEVLKIALLSYQYESDNEENCRIAKDLYDTLSVLSEKEVE